MRRDSIALGVVAALGVSLLAIGALAITAPEVAARMYGVPSEGVSTRAYVWATGLRDVAIGGWLLALVALRVDRRVIATSILVLALIPLGDLLIVAVTFGLGSKAALALHGAAIGGFAVLGGWLRQATGPRSVT